jgi:hypothetical protein
MHFACEGIAEFTTLALVAPTQVMVALEYGLSHLVPG